MEPHEYIIQDIQGDYAYLKQTDADNDELFQVAMALLPPTVDVGTRLSGMMGMFEVIG
ncbi:MAG: chorismate--pyruvate lyase [Oscillospiraceae bacterium]|nr:chorismate--pyruvate lyase [Oscillospiraceae bacterium]MBR1898684.1 chorismate--pyruvate lyase [Oscillospiraceae bacterium]